MQINDRIRLLRKDYLNITQEEFASKIKISRSNLGSIEVGRINVTNRVIEDICSQFNVSEDWLRNGKGKIFVEPDTFSLDGFVKERGMSQLELDIVKCYFELDPEIRKAVLKHLKDIFDKHSETAVSREDDINKKLEDYRLELEAEQKEKTSSASHQPKENLK